MIFERVVGTNDDLYSINADGTGLATLANSADDEYVGGITSDNRVIVNRYAGGAQMDIYIINADGTGGLNPVLVAPDSDSAYGVTSSNRIIVHRFVGGQFDMYSINPDGSGLVVLANSADSEMIAGVNSCYKCGFSEGITANNRVIFWRYVGGNQFDLYSINADGTGLATLANSADDEYYYDIF